MGKCIAYTISPPKKKNTKITLNRFITYTKVYFFQNQNKNSNNSQYYSIGFKINCSFIVIPQYYSIRKKYLGLTFKSCFAIIKN